MVLVSAIVLTFSVHASTDFQAHRKARLPSNADSCVACHAVPITGGSSKIVVTRVQVAGPEAKAAGSYVLHSVGQVIPEPLRGTQGERVAISLLGDGYVEVIDAASILRALDRQQRESRGRIRGQINRCPALETGGLITGIGRFGWKDQHSSLRSACADSMLNELGVPNHLYAADMSLHSEDEVALEKIVAFVRALPPPEREKDLAATGDSLRGEQIFSRIGCALCHVTTMRTLPPGSEINGGTYRVPKELGGKDIHPYSDFLLHDVGTGDGILQAATSEFVDLRTANRFRTPPLWGLRYRSWLLHDGKSVTLHQAIMRHGGEASDVTSNYEKLTPVERQQLDQFLNSL